MSTILITVDVEDWFQVENFKAYIPFSAWPGYDLRVERNTYKLLEILDFRGATFFILGWLAERLPHLVRDIHVAGHEVASHGYDHILCNQQSYEELKADLIASRKRLEDIIGAPVVGYRAPSFSVDNDILKIIEESGYRYDSSFNSFAMHGRYGRVDLSRNRTRGIAVNVSADFYELPISNFRIGTRIFPLGGGGYFRMIPFPLFKLGVRKILEQDQAYLFYMHPWEIDPEQPRMTKAALSCQFRHYVNLKRTQSKLTSLFRTFRECEFVGCRQHLDDQAF